MLLSHAEALLPESALFLDPLGAVVLGLGDLLGEIAHLGVDVDLDLPHGFNRKGVLAA